MDKLQRSVDDLITCATVTILSSVDDDGCPNTKAMLPPRKRNGIREVYLTTNTSSMRVGQYRCNPKACVYFFDNRRFQGVMLKGTVDVLEDAASKEMIWRDGDEMYYPKGVSDPDYCVLKFTAFEGRWYGNFSSETFPVQ